MGSFEDTRDRIDALCFAATKDNVAGNTAAEQVGNFVDYLQLGISSLGLPESINDNYQDGVGVMGGLALRLGQAGADRCVDGSQFIDILSHPKTFEHVIAPLTHGNKRSGSIEQRFGIAPRYFRVQPAMRFVVVEYGNDVFFANPEGNPMATDSDRACPYTRYMHETTVLVAATLIDLAVPLLQK